MNQVSTLHLCCISVDRYFAIIKPFDYRHYMNTRSMAPEYVSFGDTLKVLLIATFQPFLFP